MLTTANPCLRAYLPINKRQRPTLPRLFDYLTTRLREGRETPSPPSSFRSKASTSALLLTVTNSILP